MPNPRIIKKLLTRKPPVKPSLSEADLINAESALGRTLFGPIPAGHQREFFHHKKNVWIWHESWTEHAKRVETTIRYEVFEDGVYKKVNSEPYVKLSGAELKNFLTATQSYLDLLKSRLYSGR